MNEKRSGSRSRKQILTAVWTRCADHVTPLYPQKLALTSPTGGGRSVGIVRVRTKATEFSLVLVSDTGLRERNLGCHLLQAIMGEEKTFNFCTFLFGLFIKVFFYSIT